MNTRRFKNVDACLANRPFSSQAEADPKNTFPRSTLCIEIEAAEARNERTLHFLPLLYFPQPHTYTTSSTSRAEEEEVEGEEEERCIWLMMQPMMH